MKEGAVIQAVRDNLVRWWVADAVGVKSHYAVIVGTLHF